MLSLGFGPILGLTELQAVAAVQTPAATPAARQIGTVKSVSGSILTLADAAGQTYTVTVVETARVLQLAPGSTDLKSAQVIAFWWSASWATRPILLPLAA